MEVERKFRVREVPAGVGEGVRLRQAYLAVEGGVEVRIRDEGGSHTLTVKGGHGLERDEVEVPLDADRFEALWPLAGDRHLEKTRVKLPLGDEGAGVVAELDRYGGRLAGLAVVEVEFPDRDQADAFEPPPWFGEELTGQRGWSNAALARDGAPTGEGAAGEG